MWPASRRKVTSPLILAVESSGPRSAVALLAGEECLSEREFARGRGGRGAGSPAVAAEEALGAAGRGPKDVELVAVSVGPGSYTGLRIGVSFAKSFAWATGAAAVAVPTLRALAEECGAGADVLVPTADAFRKQDVFSLHPGGNPPGRGFDFSDRPRRKSGVS